MASIVLLVAAIGAMLWFHGSRAPEVDEAPLRADPFAHVVATPSMKATRKYFFAVIGLLLLQVGMGAVTAHYAVEGDAFFGLPLAQVLPYVVSRTVHTQVGIFWIATAWLATGLYIAPLLSGHEPKLQKLGVDVLFWALIAIVVGSTATGWLGTLQHRGVDFSFWIGNQGLEYTSMGRVWQLLLFVGLLFWLLLLGRALWPALKKPSETRGLIAMVFLSATCIGGFYASSLMWGQHSHYAMIEYWRWWLVHLWVEGFFEVFATVVIAFLFAKLRLVGLRTAGEAALAGATIYLAGGIIGTLHHLYFSGTPTVALALGSIFSALEVVPLMFVGYEAWHNVKLSRTRPWVQQYKWPIACFIAVAFWNMIGAGLFGFMINPPIALYYMQGLNTTPLHGHAALFGVYGMLGIGLMLFCLKAMRPTEEWNDGLLRFAFWSLNTGLLLMVTLSLLPVGLMQTWASVTHGYWYARSADFLQTPTLQFFRWLRVLGDTVFSAGAVALIVFVFSLARRRVVPEPAVPRTQPAVVS
jgi:nitric oxide reductase subunit B